MLGFAALLAVCCIAWLAAELASWLPGWDWSAVLALAMVVVGLLLVPSMPFRTLAVDAWDALTRHLSVVAVLCTHLDEVSTRLAFREVRLSLAGARLPRVAFTAHAPVCPRGEDGERSALRRTLWSLRMQDASAVRSPRRPLLRPLSLAVRKGRKYIPMYGIPTP